MPLLGIPLNVAAVLWVIAAGSLWPSVDASATNLLKSVVAPILIVGLTAVTILVLVQRSQQGGITTAQACLHTVLWVALLLFGLAFRGLEQGNGGAPILLRLIGQGPLTCALSGLLWTLSTFVAWGAGIALLALLILGIDSKPQCVPAELSFAEAVANHQR
jgi:hypothetical protein